MRWDEKEHRYKAFCLDESYLLDVLNAFGLRDRLRLFKPIGLPADAEIHHVENSWSYRALVVLVWSKEFPVVDHGLRIDPKEFIEMETIQLLRSDLPMTRFGTPAEIRNQIAMLQEMLRVREITAANPAREG